MIRLFTDSSANLPEEIVRRQQITVIPFTYTLDGREGNPLDKNFDGRAFYAAMRAGANAKTSMINTATFTEYFAPALEAGEDVLYIGMSGGISGTLQAAVLAAEELRPRYPQRQIEIVDSLGASLGEGMLALEAAARIRHGDKLSDIVRRIRRHIRLMCQCFTVDDLQYLKKSGRISGAVAMVGGLLGIRPLLVGDAEGHIVMAAKVRGARQVLDALADRYDRLVLKRTAPIGIAHADNEDGVRYLLKKLKEKGFAGQEMTVCYEPVTGSHVGPGAVALFFFGKNRSLLA